MNGRTGNDKPTHWKIYGNRGRQKTQKNKGKPLKRQQSHSLIDDLPFWKWYYYSNDTNLTVQTETSSHNHSGYSCSE